MVSFCLKKNMLQLLILYAYNFIFHSDPVTTTKINYTHYSVKHFSMDKVSQYLGKSPQSQGASVAETGNSVDGTLLYGYRKKCIGHSAVSSI